MAKSKFFEIENFNLDSGEAAILAKNFKKEIFILVSAVLGLLLYFAFSLAVINHQKFANLAENNFKDVEIISGERGLILDRKGKPLTVNTPIFDLKINLEELSLDDKEKAEVINELSALGLWDKLSQALAGLASTNSGQGLILRDIPLEQAIILKTFQATHHSVELVNDFKRSYIDGPVFAPLIGYLGLVDSTVTSSQYGLNDYIGKAGIEKVAENYLRGNIAQKIIEHDARGRIISVNQSGQPVTGANIYLTIDSDLQTIIYNSMEDFFQANGFKRGAAIALNPQTGEVLAMVSLPSFDNNAFISGDKSMINNILDNSNHPLFNRVISGDYSPGSTIKPLVALAALQEKIIDPNKEIFTNGYIEVPNPYDPTKPSIFRDWRNNGWTDMYKAIADSVNVYFYTLGGGYGDIKGLGVSKLDEYYSNFGLGKTTGIDFPWEESGFIPTPAWKAKFKPDDPIWRIGDTYNISIGQGDVLATPLQIAQWTSIFANGGYLIRPRLIDKVIDNNDKVIYLQKRSIDPLNVDPRNVKIVKEGMRQTVSEGTGIMLADLPIQVAGKSGTPQTSGGQKLNAIFTSFFPYQNPKITLVVLVEDAKEGSLAAIPIVKSIIQQYWALGKLD